MNRRQGAFVALAAVSGAVSNLVCMFAARRALPDVAHYEEFLAFWSLMFGLYGVLSGIMNESTRAAGAVAAGREPGVRLVVPATIIGAVASLVVAALFPAVAPVVPVSGWAAGAVLVATGLSYAVYTVLLGSSAGLGQWAQYAGLLTSETVLRMVLVAGLGTLGVGLVGLEWACLLAIGGAVAFLLTRAGRRALLARSDATLPVELRHQGLAAFSTACTAVLVTAYPAIMKGTAKAGDAALGAALIIAVSLCRAPIMMPLTSFQGVAIKAFLAHRDAPLRAVAKPSVILLALGALGGAAAWVVGPWFVRTVFAVADVPGWVFAALTFSSAFLAILTLLGALALAVDRHGLYAAGWLVGSGVAVGLLLLVTEPTARVVWSLAVGPLVGCLVFLAGLSGRAAGAQPIREPSSL